MEIMTYRSWRRSIVFTGNVLGVICLGDVLGRLKEKSEV